MAHGIEFAGVNAHPGAPKGMKPEDCGALPVRVAIHKQLQNPCCISCFQLTPEELEEVNKNGGKIYLSIIGWQVPVAISSFDLNDDARDLTEQESSKMFG